MENRARRFFFERDSIQKGERQLESKIRFETREESNKEDACAGETSCKEKSELA